MEHKYYVIYQVTNNVNGKIYIGKHKTDDLEDGYFGSGKYLKRAQNKYSLENFTFKVLFYLHNEEEMNLLENYVVTPEFCNRTDTYNIMEGGSGGWNYVNLSSDYCVGSEKRKEKFHIAGGKTCQQLSYAKYGMSWTKHNLSQMSEQQYKDYCNRISEQLAEYYKTHKDCICGKNNPMFGHKQTPQAKNAISQKVSGQSNGAYGKHWYKDPNSKEYRMYKDGKQPNGWIRGKYQKPNDVLATNAGKVLIRKKDLSEQKYVSKADAQKMIDSGKWEHKALPFSAQALENIRKANRESREHTIYTTGIAPSNKNKTKCINTTTNEIVYIDRSGDIPTGYVVANGNMICCINTIDHTRLYIYKENPIPDAYVPSTSLNKKLQRQITQDSKAEYIKETQEMADYYTKYGYEETCKKFPGRSGTCSVESMLMRFIRAKKKYGIKFEHMAERT